MDVLRGAVIATRDAVKNEGDGGAVLNREGWLALLSAELCGRVLTQCDNLNDESRNAEEWQSPEEVGGCFDRVYDASC